MLVSLAREFSIVAVSLLTLARPAFAQCEWQWRNYDAQADGTVLGFYPWDGDGDGVKELLVGGSFSQIGGVAANGIAVWDGERFSAFAASSIPSVYTFAEFQGSLYAANDSIYRWTGSQWLHITSAPGGHGLLVHDGNLIAYGPIEQGIKRWDGVSWYSYGSGMSDGYLGDDPVVDDVAVYNGELYACGNFNEADGKQCTTVVRWDGTTWHSLPGAPEPRTSAVRVFDDKLYAGGLSRLPWYSPFSYWDGTAWTYPAQPDSDVYALHPLNGQLALGGGFALPYEGVALWDGTNYCGLAGGTASVGQSVFALTEFDGALYAGGTFREVDGMPIEYFAIWEQVLAGDFTGDKLLDLSDLGLLLSAYDTCPGDPAYDQAAGTLADDGNDCVNLGDLGVVLANWGATCE